MIPISVFPKRFVAALGLGGKFRKASLTQLQNFSPANKRYVAAQNAAVIMFSTNSREDFTRPLPREFSTAANMATQEKLVDSPMKYEGWEPSSSELVGHRSESWWTGKSPSECKGFNPKTGELRSINQVCLAPGLCSRKSLQDYFDNTVRFFR